MATFKELFVMLLETECLVETTTGCEAIILGICRSDTDGFQSQDAMFVLIGTMRRVASCFQLDLCCSVYTGPPLFSDEALR